MAAKGPSAGVSDTELFWTLLDKADRKFSKARESPTYSKSRPDPDLHKAFKIYTRLWKMQQENRQKLTEAGLRRWEIGEIASRIAQLYYVQYQRTGQTTHLAECYIFNEAVMEREYFSDGLLHEPALAVKQLRFVARFLVVCLLLGRRPMVVCLANAMKQLVDDCKKNFQELELMEWKKAVYNIHKFMKADTNFMNMRPLRYSYFHDSRPDCLPSLVSSNEQRFLSDALLCSFWHNEVKFSELSVDTFRMIQSLEWEPCGSFTMPAGLGSSDSQYSKHWQDLRDPALPPNPRKVLLYRPFITEYLLILATMCKELPLNGVLLVYLSAMGKGKSNLPAQLSSSTTATDVVEENLSSLQINRCTDDVTSKLSTNGIDEKEWCLDLGSEDNEGLGGIYPGDLIPFTRKPLFLIIDSSISCSFKAIHGSERGETAAILLSPTTEPPSEMTNLASVRGQNGGLFTMFLTAPLQAFCLILGIPTTDINSDMFEEAEKLLLSGLTEWELVLTSSDSLDLVWMQVVGDPFLRRLLLRFIFCRTVLALNTVTLGQSEFLPECFPVLPVSVLPESPVSQTAIKKLAEYFNVTQQFAFLT